MFGRKTQQERDAAFLEAVGKHSFKKVQKLLKKGANALARDAGGNTALHKLTGAADYMEERKIADCILTLLQKSVDINARNKEGRTALHLVAEKPHAQRYLWDSGSCDGAELLRILLNRGAQIGDRDNAGRTVLHIAAGNAIEDVVSVSLAVDPSLIAAQDNEGRYPYQSAIAGVIQHHALSQRLKQKLDAYQSPPAEEKPVVIVEPVAQKVDADWILLKSDEVAHVCVQKSIGYKLTEIFNFSGRIYSRITHNLETKADVSETKGFDEFMDKSLFLKARQELLRLDGQAEEASVYGRVLDKKRSFSKDA
jgi:hypothetical protein